MSREEEASSWLTRIKHLLQVEPKTKQELLSLLRDANMRALIDTETQSMIEGVIHVSDMRVRDIMLPKKQMISVNINDTLNHLIQIVTDTGHSRFPVCDDNDESNIIGILHAKDLLRFVKNPDHTFDLEDIIRTATFVPESKRLDRLLGEFRHNRNHMALVVDEYGVISGFVTIEDIIEQIIGDIEDEFDIDEEAYIKVHANDHYIIKAHTPIELVNEALGTHFSFDTYDTIGGIVMANFGYLPKPGEVIVIDNFEFRIISADARHIKLVDCIDRRHR